MCGITILLFRSFKKWIFLWQLWHAENDTTPEISHLLVRQYCLVASIARVALQFYCTFLSKICFECWIFLWQLWHAENDTTPEIAHMLVGQYCQVASMACVALQFSKMSLKFWTALWQVWHAENDTTPEIAQMLLGQYCQVVSLACVALLF